MVTENSSQGLEQLKIKWLSNDSLMQTALDVASRNRKNKVGA